MKSINKFLLLVLIVVGSSYGYSKPAHSVKPNLNETVDRHLSGFNAVNVAGPFDVQIKQGNTESVKVEAPADVMDKILTDVNDGVLKIHSKQNSWNWGNWWGNHKKILIYVTIKEINNVNITGSGDVTFKEGLSANSLKLHISGSGDMTGRIDVRLLDSSISGSGDMTLSGKADNSTVSVVGSGDFRAHNLLTVNSTVRLSGSGDATINASEKVDAAVHGSGDIHYTGSAKNITSSKTGSGDISRI